MARKGVGVCVWSLFSPVITTVCGHSGEVTNGCSKGDSEIQGLRSLDQEERRPTPSVSFQNLHPGSVFSGPGLTFPGAPSCRTRPFK